MGYYMSSAEDEGAVSWLEVLVVKLVEVIIPSLVWAVALLAEEEGGAEVKRVTRSGAEEYEVSLSVAEVLRMSWAEVDEVKGGLVVVLSGGASEGAIPWGTEADLSATEVDGIGLSGSDADGVSLLLFVGGGGGGAGFPWGNKAAVTSLWMIRWAANKCLRCSLRTGEREN